MVRKKRLTVDSASAIAAPRPDELTLATLKPEFEAVTLSAQRLSEGASLAGLAKVANTLHISAGILGDKWLLLRDVSDVDTTPRFTCECHGQPSKELEKALRIFGKWLPRVLINTRQLSTMFEQPLTEIRGNLQTVYYWSNTLGTSVDKLIRYRDVVAEFSPELVVLAAHRWEIRALLDKLARAQAAA